MSSYLAVVLATIAAQSVQATMRDEIVVAQRFIAAVQNKHDYQVSDFVVPLRQQDKAFLAVFSRCGVAYAEHTALMHPKRSNTFVKVPGQVAIKWKCKGISKETPTDLSLHFENGKIRKIETHRR